jgi:hypothetical protein
VNESKSKERKHLSMHGVLRLGRSGRVERDLPINISFSWKIFLTAM